jgi:phosphomannomutase
MLSDFGKPIDVRYGGSTSFDIFPEGWDKSFALNHFPNKEVWFIGASCEKDENDKEIYDACGDRSYITTGPQATIDVIYDIISRIEKEKDE